MQLFLLTKIFFSLVTMTSCTDLFAILNGYLYLVQDADGDPGHMIHSKMDLPIPLSFPVAIAHDMQHHRLFVADLSSKVGSIFLLQLSREHELVSMRPILGVKDSNSIETMVYDPRLSMLYWTDSGDSGLWKMEVPEDPSANWTSPVRVLELEHIKQPRGLSLDFCNENLYWTDRGKNNSGQHIEVYNFDTSQHQILKDAKDSNNYFQALNIDLKNSKLMWLETTGDQSRNSSCIFKTSDLLLTSENTHLELEHCYPFSLAHDEKYIYWSDWAKRGIFRVSRTNGEDVEKLIDIQTDRSAQGYLLKYFGLTTLMHTVESISEICSRTRTPNVQKLVNKSEEINQHIENDKEEGASPIKIAEVALDEVIENQGEEGARPLKTAEVAVDETEEKGEEGASPLKTAEVAVDETIENKGEEGASPLKTAKMSQDGAIGNDRQGGAEVAVDEMSKTIDLPDKEEERTSKSALTYDFPESTTNGDAQKISESVEIFPLKILGGKSKRKGYENSDDRNENPSADCKARCPVNSYQLPLIISLAMLCVIFMMSTLFLVVQHYRRVHKPPLKQHFPRRFGPKKKIDHFKPTKFHDDDGVRIDIEDCCQMTLCETPCYTTVKREGGSEKLHGKRSAKCQEVKVLLDDSDVPDF